VELECSVRGTDTPVELQLQGHVAGEICRAGDRHSGWVATSGARGRRNLPAFACWVGRSRGRLNWFADFGVRTDECRSWWVRATTGGVLLNLSTVCHILAHIQIADLYWVIGVRCGTVVERSDCSHPEGPGSLHWPLNWSERLKCAVINCSLIPPGHIICNLSWLITPNWCD
jgi:hypothetical protein